MPLQCSHGGLHVIQLLRNGAVTKKAQIHSMAVCGDVARALLDFSI